MKNFYSLLLSLLFTGWYTLLPAQVKFTTVLNEKEIGKADEVQVQYIVENAESVEKITPPVFKGFTVLSGPSHLKGMSLVNGALSKYEGISYLLQPAAAGKFTIDGATAVVNGKTIKSNAVLLVVTNSITPKSPNTGPSFNWPIPELSGATEEVAEDFILKPGESIATKIQNNLFTRVEVSKTNCYEGEPVVATYKLYSRLKSESKVTKRPNLNGFSVYDMIPPGSGETRVEKINGRLFNVHIIRKVQLYPLQPGVFELDAVELDNTVHFIRVNSKAGTMQQLLDDYNNGAAATPEQQTVTLSSKPVSIAVKPLPVNGKPEAFEGAVGTFTIKSFVNSDIFSTSENGKLQVEIIGEGNLPLINAPEIGWPAGAEAGEPEINELTDKTVCPIKGTKIFEYPFSVREPGSLKIPSISFCYFDPASSTFKTIKTDSINLTITKGIDSPSRPAPNKTVSTNADKPNYGYSWWLIIPVLVVAALFIVFRLSSHNKKKKASIIAEAKKRLKEETPAADPLAAARLALYNNNSQLFYREVGNAVWNLLSAKFSITSSELNKPAVIQLLKQKNISNGIIQQFESVVHDCEMALYTPNHSETNMKATLQNASRLIEQLQALP